MQGRSRRRLRRSAIRRSRTRARRGVWALGFAVLVIGPAACGGEQAVDGKPLPRRPRERVEATLKERAYSATILNAGTRRGAVYMSRAHDTFIVYTNSAAVVARQIVRGPTLASTRPRDISSGTRAVAVPREGRGTTERLGPDQFSFMPIASTPMTVEDVRGMRGGRRQTLEAIAAHLPRNGRGPFAGLVDYAYLLAWAPLAHEARTAVAWLAAHTSGISVCGRMAGVHELCAASSLERVRVRFGVGLRRAAITIRVRRESPLFPGLPVGRVVEADAIWRDGPT